MPNLYLKLPFDLNKYQERARVSLRPGFTFYRHANLNIGRESHADDENSLVVVGINNTGRNVMRGRSLALPFRHFPLQEEPSAIHPPLQTKANYHT